MIMKDKALKSGVWYTFSSVIVKGLGFLSIPIFTRLMPKSTIGDFSNYSTWLYLFTIMITLNLEASFISAKYDYKDEFDDYTFSILSLMIALSVAWLLMFCTFINPLSEVLNVNRDYLPCIAITILFSSSINVFQIKKRFLYEYKSSTLISVFVAILTMALSVILVIISNEKMLARILGLLIPAAIFGMVVFIILYKEGHRVKLLYWKYAIPICIPYIPHLLSLSILNSIDKVMITRICGSEANALYSVAYSAGQIITLFLTSMNQAYVPWLVDQMHIKSYKVIRKFSYIYVLGFVLFVIGIMLIGPEALFILGGKEYEEAIFVICPVAMGCVCQFLYTMFVNIEQIEKKTIGMAMGSLIAATINYLLNIIFIPLYGYIAAAYTTFAGFFVLLIIHMSIVYKMRLNKLYDYKFIFLCIIGVFIFGVFCNYLYTCSLVRYVFIGIYATSFTLVVYIKWKIIVDFIKKKW